MYSLTIHFGPNAVVWTFMFKNEEKAYEAVKMWEKNTQNPSLIITDDYGQHGFIMKADIHGVLLENVDLSQEARIIRSLDQARGQARTQKRASSDPELQALMRGQGPGVLTPFSNGGFR